MSFINPIFLTDSYKLSHKQFEISGTSLIYSNFTPRFTKYFEALYPQFDGKIVWFGLQYVLKKIFVDAWNEGFFNRPKDEVISEAKLILGPYIGMSNLKHFEDLHDLGYLPILIKALPEGVLVNKGVPTFTIENTSMHFSWLPNYLETILINELWKPMTVATVGRQFRLLSNEFALKTNGSTDGVEFQNHDFSFRSQSSWESAAINGLAFLLSSSGTDNIPALYAAEKYYQAKLGVAPIAHSVSAGEHSVTTLGINYYDPTDKLNGEESFLEDLLVNKFPTGILSYVCDSYDYYSVITKVLPALKEDIMARDGKLVCRADSGDQVIITCGLLSQYAQLGNHDELNEFMLECVDGDKFTYEGRFFTVDGKQAFKEEYDETTYSENIRGTLYQLINHCVVIKEDFVDVNSPEFKGTIELLWDIFGGTINSQGYKVLDSHIGFIYGDGITWQRAQEILSHLEAKGFASTNVVFGIGGHALSSSISRDTLGIAIKASYAEVGAEEIELQKDPKTDQTKKSPKGLISIQFEDGQYVLHDQQTFSQADAGELYTVFIDGMMINTSAFSEIKRRLWQ